eukprot:1132421-Lingulodinium_polyedra.AAC.1
MGTWICQADLGNSDGYQSTADRADEQTMFDFQPCRDEALDSQAQPEDGVLPLRLVSRTPLRKARQLT